MKTRVFSLFLGVVVMLSLLSIGASAADCGSSRFTKRNAFSSHTFTDVGPDDWFYDNVRSVYESGLMVGNSASTFNPKGDLTIAEAITVASRLHSIYYTGEDTFAESAPWYQTYVDYAEAAGIISSDHADYHEPVVRAVFAGILAAALPGEALQEINHVADNAIPDVKTGDAYAEAVYHLYRAGILVGNDASGTFAPDRRIRRCEAAAIVSRMSDTSLRKTVEPGSLDERDAAISSVLYERYRSEAPDGLIHTQSYHLLAEEKSNGEETVYLIVYYGIYRVSETPEELESGIVPAAITFSVDETGAYSMKEYWTPGDDADYEGSIRAKFPGAAADEALCIEKYAEALHKQNWDRVTEYLNELKKPSS